MVWPLFTNDKSSFSEASALLLTYDFRKFIFSVNVLTFRRKIVKVLFQNRILK